MSEGFQITREGIEAGIASLNSINEKIRTAKGNAARRLETARLSALGSDVQVTLEDFPTMPPKSVKVENLVQVEDEGGALVYEAHGGKEDERPVVKMATMNLGTLAVFARDLAQFADQMCQEQVTLVLQGMGTDSSVDVLQAKFRDEAKVVEAMLTVAPMMGVNVEGLVLPTLKGGGRITTSVNRARNTGSGKQRCYRIVDGQRHDLQGGGGVFSAMAYYWGADVLDADGEGSTNKGKGVSADALANALRGKGIESPQGKAWTYTNARGVTYGMDVSSDDETASTGEEE